VEAATTPSEGLGTRLDRVEGAVDAGNADLKELGFWPLVAEVKRDDALIERHADQVGRIDGKAFRARVPLRVPVWAAAILQVVAIAVGVGLVALAIGNADGDPADAFLDPAVVSGLALLLAAFLWSAGAHSLTHLVVGRIVGIRFTDFFFALPPPPLPGLKSDYATYLRATPIGRAWMHASGAIATKLAPFVALAFAPAAEAPWWAVVGLLGLAAFQISTDVLLSTKSSDWKKVRRELAVARARRSGAEARTDQASPSASRNGGDVP
jgi:hypothetical protein